jgi:hypothetical protein
MDPVAVLQMTNNFEVAACRRWCERLFGERALGAVAPPCVPEFQGDTHVLTLAISWAACTALVDFFGYIDWRAFVFYGWAASERPPGRAERLTRCHAATAEWRDRPGSTKRKALLRTTAVAKLIPDEVLGRARHSTWCQGLPSGLGWVPTAPINERTSQMTTNQHDHGHMTTTFMRQRLAHEEA